MNLKVRLLIIPSLLAAGLLGACGPQEADQDVPEQPGIVEDEAGVVEPEVGEPDDVGVVETPLPAEEDVVEGDTPLTDEEGVAEGDTPLTDEEGVAAADTPAVSAEEDVAAVGTPGTEPAEETTDQMAGTETEPGMGTFDTTSAVKASEIIGYDVENAADEDLGEIEDLLVDVNTNQVKYAVLSFGGFLDIGDKLFAIPLNAINFNAEEQAFIFDITEERLENAPGFARDDWPDFANPDWDLDNRDYWQTEEEAMVDDTDMTEEGTEDQAAVQGDADLQNPEAVAGGPVVQASELLDFNIHNAQNEEIGEVEDIIIQMNQDHMAYAVLSLEDMMDDTATEERLYAIPLNQLQFNSMEDDFFVFNADPQMLDNALSFGPDEWSQQMNLEDVN